MDRPPHRWHRRLLGIAALLGATAFVLFLLAGGDVAREQGLGGNWTTRLFEAIAFIGFEPPRDELHESLDSRLLVARVLLAATAALGISGLVFEFSESARDAARRISFWLARVVGGKAPAVVIGLGGIGAPLVRDLRKRNRRPVFVIEPEGDSPAADEARQAGALVLRGDAKDERILQSACIDHASEVFVATGDEIRNIEIAGELIRDTGRRRGVATGERTGALDCYVHVADPGFAAAFSSHRLLFDPTESILFHTFNLQQQAARDLLLDPEHGIARRYPGAAVPYYIVFGFGSMGQTVALQMARLAHFNTFRRLRLSIVDEFGADPLGSSGSRGPAGRTLQAFLDRYPAFCPDPNTFDLLAHRKLAIPNKDGWDCRFWRPAEQGWRSDDENAVEYAANAEFLDLASTVDAPALVDTLLARIESVPDQGAGPHAEPPMDPVLVLAFDEERRNFEAALALRQALETARFDGTLSRPLPLYVYLRTETGLATLLQQAPEFVHSEAVRLHVFGLREAEDLYRQIARLEVRRMARVVQESYNAFYDGTEGFDALSPAFQASNIDAAAHADVKLDAIGRRRRPVRDGEQISPMALVPDQIATLAHMEHNRWMAERLTSGWRIGERREKRAGVIRLENRRRPSFVPWTTLSEEQKYEKGKDVSQVLALNEMYWRVGQVVEAIEEDGPDPGDLSGVMEGAVDGASAPDNGSPGNEPSRARESDLTH
jgi:hypothetical protein